MVRLTLPVPSLIGGVSTQPEATRLPQQAERSDNCIGTVVEGLRRRPPTEHLHSLPILATGAQHDIHLDEGGYIVSTDGSTELRVFDIETGAAQNVLNANGQLVTAGDLTYLNTNDPRNDLRFLTLSDYTLILNRTASVAISGVTPARRSQALIRVTQGAYRVRYVLRVSYQGVTLSEVAVETYASDGAVPGSNTPGNAATAEASVRTDTIARELASMLDTGTPLSGLAASYSSNPFGAPLGPSGNWNIDVSGSTIRIQRIDGTDFDVTIDESIGQSSMTVINKEVQLFSELPRSAPAGMVVEVAGDPQDSDVSYWVRFVSHDENAPINQWTEGFWEESVEPNIADGLAPETMPHALIRQADGQWRYTALTGEDYIVLLSGVATTTELPGWTKRTVGGGYTNILPDFVAGQIRGMCFHEGRLGLLSKQSLTLSEVREPFNFFRTTVVDVIDGDRIIIKAPSRKAETLHHAIPLSGDIVLFTEETQYLVRSEGPFAPNSVSLIAAGNHDADPTAEPVPVRGMLFVPREVGGYGAVSALQTLGDQRPSLDSADVTANVPGYLDVPHRIITTPQLDIVAAYGDGSSSLFVFSQFYNANEKVHQSWQRWTFDAGTILHAWFHETDLYILAQVGSEEHLWKLRAQPEATDGTDPITYLDQRISSTSLATPVVNAAGNTVYTFDFTPPAAVEARVQTTLKAARVLSIEDFEVEVEGNTQDVDLWFGVPFESRHDLSRIVTTDSQRAPESHGLLRLDTGSVLYDETGAFDVVIMDNFGGEASHRFSGPYLGQGANYQNVRLTSGKLVFPIRGRSEDLRVSIRTNSTEAMRLVSMDINVRRSRMGSRQRTQ